MLRENDAAKVVTLYSNLKMHIHGFSSIIQYNNYAKPAYRHTDEINPN